MRGRRKVGGLLLMLLLATAFEAAAMRRIEPGESPRLRPGEGLVVLAVDAGTRISSIRVDHAAGGNAEVLNYLGQGRNLSLYAAPAGEYEWSRVNVTGWNVRTRFELKGESYRFKVVEGQISYPGELLLRPLSWTSARIHVANHGLPAIDWLERHHPDVYRQYRFVYVGHYPDPFPEFYRAARSGDTRAASELDSGREPPRPGALPVDAETMWRPSRVGDYSLSPSGRLFAEAVREEDGAWTLRLIDLVTGRPQTLLRRRKAPGMVAWKDDHTLVVEEPGGSYSHVVYRVTLDGERDHRVERVPIIGKGRVVDLLPADPEAVLFEGFDSHRQLVVHRVALRGDRDIRGFATAKTRDRLNKGVERDIAWFADGHGRLRAAVALREEDAVLLYGRDGAYEEILRPRPEGGFEPAGLSFDGGTIYGYSDDGRSQRDLVAFDPARREMVRTVFSKDGVDIVGMVVDAHREPVAARYYLSGQLVTEYFAETGQALERRLKEAFPGDTTVAVVDRSDDGQQLILWVDGSDRPARLYHLDLGAGRASLLEDSAPWLDGQAFAPTRVVHATSRDGLPIEAFLTLPDGRGDRPLVVFPHGGPIGVSDRRHFDRDVQFLALQGFAVLQVNFRGSDGYGKAFREAGMGNYGTRIEDDIDAALQATLAGYPVDGNRICMLGTSYGGYSALVSAIRWPGRFRCAVSISGVSDRPLFFTASDSVRDPAMRPLLERAMGDPRTQLDEMKASSPLYRVDELDIPLMLVHGREDNRVDFEHTRRLVRMLNLRRRPPVVLAFPGMGHGFDDPVATDIAWTGIAGFLQTHLLQARPGVPEAGGSGVGEAADTDAGAGEVSIGGP